MWRSEKRISCLKFSIRVQLLCPPGKKLIFRVAAMKTTVHHLWDSWLLGSLRTEIWTDVLWILQGNKWQNKNSSIGCFLQTGTFPLFSQKFSHGTKRPSTIWFATIHWLLVLSHAELSMKKTLYLKLRTSIRECRFQNSLDIRSTACELFNQNICSSCSREF